MLFGAILVVFPRSDRGIDYIPRYSKIQYFTEKHQIENVEAR